jgi:hypothetical protein
MKSVNTDVLSIALTSMLSGVITVPKLKEVPPQGAAFSKIYPAKKFRTKPLRTPPVHALPMLHQYVSSLSSQHALNSITHNSQPMQPITRGLANPLLGTHWTCHIDVKSLQKWSPYLTVLYL